MIKYRDSRALLPEPLPFTEVILQGIAPGGGLFVPEHLPVLSLDDIQALGTMPYWRRAADIYRRIELDVPEATVLDVAQRSYGDNFDVPEIAPVRVCPNRFVLSCGTFISPSRTWLCSMPRFFSGVGGEPDPRVAGSDFLVLVATSGDTG